MGCDSCHGTAHGTAADASKARLPGPDTCARCHATQVKQYQGSKHALAWAAMMAMPTFHYQPAVLTDGLKGCGGCHAIGLREEADQKAIARVSGTRLRRGELRLLPHPPHLLGEGGPRAAGVQELPHGVRPRAVGDVRRLQARRPPRAREARRAAPTAVRPHLPDLPHAEAATTAS